MPRMVLTCTHRQETPPVRREREHAMTKQLCGNSMMMTMMHMCGMCMLCYGKMVILFHHLPE